MRSPSRECASGEHVAVGDGAGLIVEGTVASTDDGELSVDRGARPSRGAPAPRALARAGAREGRPGRARGPGRDRAGRERRDPVGGGALACRAGRARRPTKGRERWAAIVREASKQAIRAWVPEVAALATTADLAALPGLVLVLEPTASGALTDVVLDEHDRITLVVGPEGGVSPNELAQFGDRRCASAPRCCAPPPPAPRRSPC